MGYKEHRDRTTYAVSLQRMEADRERRILESIRSVELRESQCTAGQRAFVNAVREESGLFALHGSWGTGKTYTVELVRDILCSRGETVITCAPTALAGSLLDGATVHHVCGWGKDKTVCRLKKDSQRWLALQCATTIILDEMSMLTSAQLAGIDRACRKTISVPELGKSPFAGKRFILCGDFFQIPPVTDDGLRHKPADWSEESWENYRRHVQKRKISRRLYKDPFVLKKFRWFRLTEPVRTKDAEFSALLESIKFRTPSPITFHALH